MSTTISPATDAHFAWMLGEEPPEPDLSLAPGGVDDPAVLAMLRVMAARVGAVHTVGHWLIVAHGEVVGLCGFKWPANRNGIAEIGYGVAASRRRLGHATRAVALMLAEALRDPLV